MARATSTSSPFRSLAQAAPSFGVQLCDFNADGYCDILLAQNFFGPQRETGRMDGGLGMLLLGAGDGTFQPMWPDTSGIVIPEDAKSLLVGDVNDDHWPDFVVGINDGEVKVYKNLAAGVGRPIVVRLSNFPGNPTAVGSRIELQTTDGKTQTAEVSAGGSYLAQSASEVYFGLGDGKGITKINVRWPDGRESTTVTPADHNVIEIDYASARAGG